MPTPGLGELQHAPHQHACSRAPTTSSRIAMNCRALEQPANDSYSYGLVGRARSEDEAHRQTNCDTRNVLCRACQSTLPSVSSMCTKQSYAVRMMPSCTLVETVPSPMSLRSCRLMTAPMPSQGPLPINSYRCGMHACTDMHSPCMHACIPCPGHPYDHVANVTVPVSCRERQFLDLAFLKC